MIWADKKLNSNQKIHSEIKKSCKFGIKRMHQSRLVVVSGNDKRTVTHTHSQGNANVHRGEWLRIIAM